MALHGVARRCTGRGRRAERYARARDSCTALVRRASLAGGARATASHHRGAHPRVQGQRKANFPYRMFEYYTLLRQREQKPVIPIALVFYPGREGIAVEEYEEIVFGQRILTFRYLRISLPLLPAEEYARAESVLGAGLACVMRLPRDRDAQIALRAACLQRVLDAVVIAQVDAARAFMLGALIETYLPLSAREREELRVQLEQEGETTMGATQLTWADELMLSNKLQTMREAIKDVIAFKFGEVPSDVNAAIDSASTEQELTALLQRAAVVRTQDDLLRTSP